MRTNAENAEITIICIENIPKYYEKVHENWAEPVSIKISAALNLSMQNLELLNALEKSTVNYSPQLRDRLSKALPNARLAIKDFISLCQSGYLDN